MGGVNDYLYWWLVEGQQRKAEPLVEKGPKQEMGKANGTSEGQAIFLSDTTPDRLRAKPTSFATGICGSFPGSTA